MRSLSCLAVLAISFSSAVLAQVPPSPTEQPNGDARQDFQDLINALPEESLQAALHGHIPQFKDGVFESGRHGVEKVHERNPRLASKLIVAAVQDLKRRQTPSNGTAGAATDASTSSQPPTSLPPSSDDSTPTVSRSVSAPPPASNTASALPSVTPTTIPTAAVGDSDPTSRSSQAPSAPPAPIPTPTTTLTPTASAVRPITTTNSKGSTVTSKTTLPAVIITTTNSAGKTTKVTSAVVDEPMAIPTTNAKGSTFITTITPTVELVSSVVYITTQGPNGEKITRTSVTYVNPAKATGQDGAPPSETSVTPGVQSGVAGPARATGAAGMLGLVGMVAIML